MKRLTIEQFRTLTTHAAHIVLQDVDSAALIACADDLLTDGVYHDAILAVAGLARQPPSEQERVIPAFTQMLGVFGLTLPTDDDALWTVLQDAVSRISDSVLPARDGLREIIDLYDFAGIEREWSLDHDPYGVMPFVALDATEPDSGSALRHRFNRDYKRWENEIVATARAWLRSRPMPSTFASLSPELRHRLFVLAARLRLGLTMSDALIELADALLTNGIYSDTILACADLGRAPTPDGADALFLRICHEHRVPTPTMTDAALIILTDVTDRIIDESTPPLDGLRAIVEVARSFEGSIAGGGAAALHVIDFDLDAFERAGEDLDILDARSAHARNTPVRETRASRQLSAHVRALAIAWRKRHAVALNALPQSPR